MFGSRCSLCSCMLRDAALRVSGPPNLSDISALAVQQNMTTAIPEHKGIKFLRNNKEVNLERNGKKCSYS